MVVKRYCKKCKDIFSLKNTTECIKIQYCGKCSDIKIDSDSDSEYIEEYEYDNNVWCNNCTKNFNVTKKNLHKWFMTHKCVISKT